MTKPRKKPTSAAKPFVVDDLWPVLLRLDDDAEPPTARRRRHPQPAELVVGLLSFAVLTAGGRRRRGGVGAGGDASRGDRVLKRRCRTLRA